MTAPRRAYDLNAHRRAVVDGQVRALERDFCKVEVAPDGLSVLGYTDRRGVRRAVRPACYGAGAGAGAGAPRASLRSGRCPNPMHDPAHRRAVRGGLARLEARQRGRLTEDHDDEEAPDKEERCRECGKALYEVEEDEEDEEDEEEDSRRQERASFAARPAAPKAATPPAPKAAGPARPPLRACLRTHAPARRSLRVDRMGHGRILGASIISKGAAEGRGFEIDDVTLDQAVMLAEGVPGRWTHGTFWEDGLGTHLGRWRNVRRAGDRVVGDFHFSPSAERVSPKGLSVNAPTYLMGLAESEPEVVGVSAAVEYDLEDAHDALTGRPRKLLRLRSLYRADYVADPAANPGGLFSADD